MPHVRNPGHVPKCPVSEANHEIIHTSTAWQPRRMWEEAAWCATKRRAPRKTPSRVGAEKEDDNVGESAALLSENPRGADRSGRRSRWLERGVAPRPGLHVEGPCCPRCRCTASCLTSSRMSNDAPIISPRALQVTQRHWGLCKGGPRGRIHPTMLWASLGLVWCCSTHRGHLCRHAHLCAYT